MLEHRGYCNKNSGIFPTNISNQDYIISGYVSQLFK